MMSLIRILVACLLAFSATAIPVAQADAQKSPSNPAATTPRLVRIFTSQAILGDFQAPIPINGGQRLVAQVTGGSIKSTGKGKGLTGTIVAGISVIDILNSGQTLVNNIRSFGSTPDGTSFLIEENGIGSPSDNFARLVCDFLETKQITDSGHKLMRVYIQILSIGGSQTNLANQFIFTEASLSADRKSVMTTAYQLLDR
ncbi:MAG: hypothetical protein Q9221_000855 [Calogaya cf. arnoldii]